ncbi:MAG: hypothetical protein Q9172_005443 [Xanthocarpia lactea]
MTHSKHATQALKDSLASTPQLDVDDALSDAVTNLQKALNSSTTYSLSATYSTQSTYDDESHGLSALPLPPSDLVLKILKRAKVEHQRIFDELPFLDLPTLINHCQKVFFATEPYSIATFIIVNTSLVYLLRGLTDQAQLDFDISRADLDPHLETLPKNVDFALRKLPLVAAHTMDNITALHLASDLQDLALLGEFVSTLRSAAEQSHAIEKLHFACNSFHHIAKAYVARGSQHVPSLRVGAESGYSDWQPSDGIGDASSQPLSDSLLSQQDWDLMLSDWGLGLGTLDARQMSSFLDLLPNSQ